MPGHLRTHSALRHEGRNHGRALTVIARLDRNLCWLVMAEPRVAIETDLSALDLPLDVLNGDGGVRQVREGREQVNGLDTVRVRVSTVRAREAALHRHVWATDRVSSRIAGEARAVAAAVTGVPRRTDGRLDLTCWYPRHPSSVKGGDLPALLEGMAAAGQIGQRR
jgi:hypothetical protein